MICGFSPFFWVELNDYHNVFQAKFDFTPWIDTSFSPTSSVRSSFSKRSSCRVKGLGFFWRIEWPKICSGVQVLHSTNPAFFTNPRFWRNLFYCQTSIKLMSYVYSELKVFFFGEMGTNLQLWYFVFDWNQTEFPLPKYQTIPPFKNCWILLACIHTLTWQQGIQPFVAYHWRFCYNCGIASMQLWTPGESVHKQVEVEPFLLSLPGDVAISCELKKWIPKKFHAKTAKGFFGIPVDFVSLKNIVLRVYINSRMLFFEVSRSIVQEEHFCLACRDASWHLGRMVGKKHKNQWNNGFAFFQKRSSHPENSHGDLVDQFTPKWIKATRSKKNRYSSYVLIYAILLVPFTLSSLFNC